MKRGQIYYIQRRDTIGAEIRKARPGVIVSNDAQNLTHDVVTVCHIIRAHPKDERPTHVEINATGVASTALCEQIDTVDKSLIGDYCGTCTDAELIEVDKALKRALGLYGTMDAASLQAKVEELVGELVVVTAQRDRYEKIIDILSLQVQL